MRQAADIVPREYQAALFEEAKAGNVRPAGPTHGSGFGPAASVVYPADRCVQDPRATAALQPLRTATTARWSALRHLAMPEEFRMLGSLHSRRAEQHDDAALPAGWHMRSKS